MNEINKKAPQVGALQTLAQRLSEKLPHQGV